MNKSDHDLFCKLCAPTHALNHLLPPTGNRASLRTRGHSYQLPEYSSDLHKKSSLIRSLYSFVEWNSFFWFCCFVLYVILTLLFVFVVWCAFVASSKYYIHTCIHTLSRTASWYYYLIHSTFLCFSRNCPNLALINQSINQSINQWKYHTTSLKIPSIASYSILVYDATVSNNAHYCFVFHCWYQRKLLVDHASSRAPMDQRFFVY